MTTAPSSRAKRVVWRVSSGQEVGVTKRWSGWVATAMLVLASGCYSESDFVPEQTDLVCDLILECTDPAELTFDGIDAQNCVATVGPMLRAAGEGCKFRRGNAKQCIEDLQAATCPADGTPVLDALPTSCGLVWDKCTAQPQDTDSPDPQDTGS